MSNQESQNQDKTKEQAGVEKRRRFIKGAGIAAPIVLTVSSPSVFGAMCLSQIMSGNQSQIGTGSCALGNNPTYWKTTLSAWSETGFSIGTKPGNGAGTYNSYSGGTTFRNCFGANPTSGNSTTTMLDIVCSNNTNTTLDAYLVAALLDASTPGSNYLYTAAEVRQLQQKSLGVPPYNSTADADVLAFLKTTMNP